MQSGAVPTGEEREKRQKRRGGGAGGRLWRQRKGGILEIKSSHKQERSEREKDRARRKLKVSMRTVWPSELDRNTAAVTSVLISPSAG